MKKKNYLIYIVILASLYIVMPFTIFFINRIYVLTDAEMFGLCFPTTMLLFFGTVGAGMLSENLKD
jgi:hypothetical protein